jgi:hypothetical protein
MTGVSIHWTPDGEEGSLKAASDMIESSYLDNRYLFDRIRNRRHRVGNHLVMAFA